MLLIFISKEDDSVIILRKLTHPKKAEDYAPLTVVITERVSGDPPLVKRYITSRTSLIIK